MSKRSFVDFEAVKAAVNITQILERYGLADQFKKSSDTWSGPCPIHKGTNQTQFRVSVSKNCWHCFSGDCLFAGSIGRTDLPLCNPTHLQASLERLALLPAETVVHPGHGPATTIAAEVATNPFLSGLARVLGA